MHPMDHDFFRSQKRLTDQLEQSKTPQYILSERENRILNLLKQGRSVDEIARIFHLSKDDIFSQMARMNVKLSRAGLNASELLCEESS